MPDAARDLLLHHAFWGVIPGVSFDQLCPRPVRVSKFLPCGPGQGQGALTPPLGTDPRGFEGFLCKKVGVTLIARPDGPVSDLGS